MPTTVDATHVLEDLTDKPDLRIHVHSWIDQVRYEATLNVYRGDGRTPDTFCLESEFGWFTPVLPTGMSKRELRDWTIQRLRDFVAHCRENAPGYGRAA